MDKVIRFVVSCDFPVETSGVPYRIIETDSQADKHISVRASELLAQYSKLLRDAGVKILQTEVSANQIEFVTTDKYSDAARKAFAEAGFPLSLIN